MAYIAKYLNNYWTSLYLRFSIDRYTYADYKTDVISAVADVSVYSDNSEVRVVDIGYDDDGGENHTDADNTIIDICKNQSDGVWFNY